MGPRVYYTLLVTLSLLVGLNSEVQAFLCFSVLHAESLEELVQSNDVIKCDWVSWSIAHTAHHDLLHGYRHSLQNWQHFHYPCLMDHEACWNEIRVTIKTVQCTGNEEWYNHIVIIIITMARVSLLKVFNMIVGCHNYVTAHQVAL